MREVACASGALQFGAGKAGRVVFRKIVLLVVMLVLCSAGVAWADPIDLTDDQMQKLKAIAVDTRDDIERERKTLRGARAELAEVYKCYKLDDGRACALIGKISKAQSELLDGFVENQVKLRQILNKEQFAGFDRMIKAKTRGVDMTMTFPVLPIEEEFLGAAIDSRMKDMSVKAGQERHAATVKWVGRKKPEAVSRLKQSSKQLADLFSDYEMNEAAARKVVNSIHRDQVSLSWMMHKRQQAIRQLLSEDEFGKLQQETAKKVKDAESRRHRQGRPK